MKRKAIRAIAWTIFSVLALGVITDVLVLLGLNRGWQYVYNAAFFLIALPGPLYTIYRTENKDNE